MKKPATVTLNHNPVLARALPAWRPRLVLMALLGGSLLLAGRALYLQGVKDDFLKAEGRSRYARTLEIPATRGRILDRNGDVLAVSTPVQSIWAIPADARLSPGQTRELASLLETDVQEINQRLDSNKGFVYLKRQISPGVAEKIATLNLPGIHQQTEYRRYYPGAAVTAHVVGFTGADDKGQEGIELAFQNSLAGKPGSHQVIKDRRGRVVEDVASLVPPENGGDVRLSLDSKIQYLAYSALNKAVQTYKAKAGGVVVLDARTGEVLALVNNPSYNPNNRESLSGAQLRNRALTDTYEPGSVMKPFIAALGLDRGKVRPATLIDTAPGRLTIGTATISDSHRHGVLSVTEVIQKSSNIGIAKIAFNFTPAEMWTYYDRLGFGHAPRLGFPGEAAGHMRPAKSWRPIEQATMSYGHGISVSLMQMATAYLALARNGDIAPISLTRLDEAPATGKVMFSAEVAKQVREMLELVTLPGGTATEAQVPGYRVGGKTGTAMKIEGGHYVKKYVASFVGIAPISNPRVIVAVMVDEPSGLKYYGGQVAAPVFSQIAGETLRALGVPPDAPLVPMQMARQQARQSRDDVRENM